MVQYLRRTRRGGVLRCVVEKLEQSVELPGGFFVRIAEISACTMIGVIIELGNVVEAHDALGALHGRLAHLPSLTHRCFRTNVSFKFFHCCFTSSTVEGKKFMRSVNGELCEGETKVGGVVEEGRGPAAKGDNRSGRQKGIVTAHQCTVAL